MPILIGLSAVLQFACLVHMVRSGRPYWWIWVILVGSFLGVAVYVVTQVLPDLQASPTARRTARRVQRAMDPARERRRIEAELAVADTVHNRARLAGEMLDLGDHARARDLFAGCLKGPHATDPALMLGLARAQSAGGEHAAARATLEALIAANPDFRSTDGHLLYAECLEGVGETERALSEYAVLAESYPGEEGRGRHARLLARLGRGDEARAVWRTMLARAKVAPRYYRRDNQAWLTEAEAGLRTGVDPGQHAGA
jgi:hypothetical protein